MMCKCDFAQKMQGDGCDECNPEKAKELLEERVAYLEGLLKDIGDFAHDRSSGPALQDDLWEVRRMAYEL